jgi:hypothetical protein
VTSERLNGGNGERKKGRRLGKGSGEAGILNSRRGI